MNHLNKFANYVKEQREIRNMSQRDFAKNADITPKTLIEIEHGRPTQPSSRAKVEQFINSNPLPEWAKSTPPESADHGIAADAAMN